uniref:Uncharacterized protein n=1 Tax=Oryza nivara TaxID=4536 RepID=A0A0E0IK04_ORYNI
MTAGIISVCEFEKELRGEQQVSTFVHTCPIGDGLMGAPICSRFGKVFGMNVARTALCSSINFALNNSQLKVELAKLLQNEDYEMSALIEKYDSEKTSASKKRKGRGFANVKVTSEEKGGWQFFVKKGEGCCQFANVKFTSEEKGGWQFFVKSDIKESQAARLSGK